jgi:hypothetical protein
LVALIVMLLLLTVPLKADQLVVLKFVLCCNEYPLAADGHEMMNFASENSALNVGGVGTPSTLARNAAATLADNAVKNV